MTFIAVPPVLRALQSAPAMSAHHTMASNELAVVEAQHAAGATLHFLLGKELVLAAIGCIPVTSTLQWCKFPNIAEITTLCAGQGKGPCPDYVTLVGVPRCADIVWPCTDDLEEIDTRQLHVCGAHAREGLADEGITGLLVALLGLLVTL